MSEKVGIILAKMAPLHKGHEFLINEALNVVDELYIVLYHTPNLISVPLNVRAGWIKDIYTDSRVKVILGWYAPNEHEDTDAVKRMQEKYIADLVEGLNITHFFSSEDYGVHMSKHLSVENVIVDRKRIELPISATEIRKDLQKNKSFLRPRVYSSLLNKVLLVGVRESTEALANEVLQAHGEEMVGLPECFEKFPLDVADKKNKEGEVVNRSRKRLEFLLMNEAMFSIRSLFIHSSSILTDLAVLSTGRLLYSSEFKEAICKELRVYDQIFFLKTEDSLYLDSLAGYLNESGIKFDTGAPSIISEKIKRMTSTSKLFV